MSGAIIGDIAGSTYELSSVKTEDFELFTQGSSFTDDMVLLAKSLMTDCHVFLSK